MRRYTHRVEGSKKEEEEEKKGKLLQSSFQFPILPFLLDDPELERSKGAELL